MPARCALFRSGAALSSGPTSPVPLPFLPVFPRALGEAARDAQLQELLSPTLPEERQEEAEHHRLNHFTLPKEYKHGPGASPPPPSSAERPAVCAHTCPRISPITQVPVTLRSFASAVTTYFLSSSQSPLSTQAKGGRESRS